MSDTSATAHVAHLLPGFLVDTLAAAEQRAVLAHLAGCPVCRAELAAWRSIAGALQEPFPKAPDDDATLIQVWRRVDASRHAVLPGPHGQNRPGRNGRVNGVPPAPGVSPLPASTPIPPALAPHTPRRRWTPMHPVSFLLVVALALGAFAIGPGRALLAPHLPRANVLTMEAPGLAGAISEETLVRATVPADMVPVGDRVRSCLSHIVIPPGARAAWEAEDAVCCPGTRLNYVLKGTYAVWPEGPVQVIRAGGSTETADAGSELLLAEGDTIVLGSDTPYAADNPGETDAELLQYILAYPPWFPRGTATLEGWDERDYDMPDIPLQGGAATMTLYRMVLGPDSVLAGPPGMALMQVTMPKDHGADAGPPRPVVSSVISPMLESTIENDGREPATVYVLALEPAGMTLMP